MSAMENDPSTCFSRWPLVLSSHPCEVSAQLEYSAVRQGDWAGLWCSIAEHSGLLYSVLQTPTTLVSPRSQLHRLSSVRPLGSSSLSLSQELESPCRQGAGQLEGCLITSLLSQITVLYCLMSNVSKDAVSYVSWILDVLGDRANLVPIAPL